MGLSVNGREVGVEELFVVVLDNICSGLAGEFEIAVDFGLVLSDHGGAGKGFVGKDGVPVTNLVLEAKVEAALGVVAGGLGAFEDCIDAGDLPLAAGEIFGLTEFAPMIVGGVGGVEHGVVLGEGAVGFVYEGPDIVEEVYGELAVGFGDESWVRHGGILIPVFRQGWRYGRDNPAHTKEATGGVKKVLHKVLTNLDSSGATGKCSTRIWRFFVEACARDSIELNSTAQHGVLGKQGRESYVIAR